MDFMTIAKADYKESTARLLHRLQGHEHTFQHPCLLTCVVPRKYSLTPSTPSSSALNASQSHIRKSTANSNTTFGTSVSASTLLRPSSVQVIHFDVHKFL